MWWISSQLLFLADKFSRSAFLVTTGRSEISRGDSGGTDIPE
jgi:hypothetical protein